MGDVINLNRFRKTRAKSKETRKAEENRIRFGRTKVEKQQDQADGERDAKDLDGKKIE